MSDADMKVPDPNGPPIARAALKIGMGILGVGSVVVTGGAVVLVLSSTNVVETRGALHSHRIEWEQRQAEITQAMAQPDHGESPTQATPPNPPEAAHE